MSATLHTALFSAYFGGCPIITVPGFTHPVEDFYLEVLRIVHKPWRLLSIERALPGLSAYVALAQRERSGDSPVGGRTAKLACGSPGLCCQRYALVFILNYARK